jgi:hypothetical protein
MTTLVGAGEVASPKEDAAAVVEPELQAEETPAADSGSAKDSSPEEVIGEEVVAAAPLVDDAAAEFGPPFTPRSFGGELVWANSEAFTSKVLRIRAGEVVLISTKGRSDMVAMLTGGRAVLEVEDDGEIIREEISPGTPTSIRSESAHRIVAMTDVELFTVYANDGAA